MSQIRTFHAGATTKDANGRVRMQLMVALDGKAEIQMLDEQGKVSKSITPTSKD